MSKTIQITKWLNPVEYTYHKGEFVPQRVWLEELRDDLRTKVDVEVWIEINTDDRSQAVFRDKLK
tara:strand:+ start:1203 stop:1397 length:195 start_codon:yes stop_codon:yes gene_type:complete